MKDINKICLPMLSAFQKQITRYLEGCLRKEDVPRLLDVIHRCEAVGKSKQIILEEYPPGVFDALLALSCVNFMIEGASKLEDPEHTILAADAISIAVRSLVAGFSFARAIDEDMAQTILAYNDKFLSAGKQPRGIKIDALDKVLEEICDDYFKAKGRLPSLHEVTRSLTNLANRGEDSHAVICKVDKGDGNKGNVYWLRNKYAESPTATSFGTINNRMTRIRTKYKTQK